MSRPMWATVTVARPQREHEPYLIQSRRPLASLAVVAPVVIAYEVGTALWHVDAAAATETRVLAFVWVRQTLAAGAGAGAGDASSCLAGSAAVLSLLLWHVFAGHPWRLRPGVPAGMTAEGTALALPLLLLAWLAVGRPAALLWAGADAAADVVLALGAGVYEELVFRLFGLTLLHALLEPLLGRRGSLVAALWVTSLAFAAYHHVPAAGEPWTLPAFVFRTAAGMWLGLVFLTRGFGVTAVCHAAYNATLAIVSAFGGTSS